MVFCRDRCGRMQKGHLCTGDPKDPVKIRYLETTGVPGGSLYQEANCQLRSLDMFLVETKHTMINN